MRAHAAGYGRAMVHRVVAAIAGLTDVLALATCGGGATVTQSGTTPSAAEQTTASKSATRSEKLIGSAPADRELPELTGFVSPSGNVSCKIDPDWARCDIIDRDWTPPPRPADCEFDYGQGISLAAGEQAQFRLRRRHCLRRGRGTAVPRVNHCRGAALSECPVVDHVAAMFAPATASRFLARRTGCSDPAGSGDR
jgi:hypothetical protein